MSYHNNPRIVTDGLVLCFDAADNKSMPVRDLPVKGSNLVCWYDAADEDSIVYGSASFVTTWEDKSGHGHHLYQNVVANQPNRVNTQNGKYILDFDGSNDFLRTSSSIDVSSEWTMFIVERRGGAGSSDAGLISINDSLASGITMHFAIAYFYWGSGANSVSIPSTTSNQMYILSKYWDGSASGTRTAYLDGTASTKSGAMTNTNSTGALRIGKQTTNFSGSIAEVIIYDKKLNSTDYALVHTYLQNKWNITTLGTIWSNRENTSLNGELRDGPSLVNNYLSFDGIANRVNVNPSSDTFTWKPSDSDNTSISIECWVKTSDSTGYIFSKPFNGSGQYNYYLTPATLVLGTDIGTTASYALNFTNIADGSWKHIVVVVDPLYATIYVNGEIHAGPSAHNRNGNDPTLGITQNRLAIMTLYPYETNPWAGQTAFSIDGDLSVFRWYNIALTSDDVLQNYRALKHRFGY